MWHQLQHFTAFVTNARLNSDMENVLFRQKLVKLADHLLWNKETFGNILIETRLLRNRFNGLQNQPSYHKSSFLQNLETTLTREYSERLSQEEDFWAQRSRISWLNGGDRNTKFFHAADVMRSKSNHIHTQPEG